MRSSLLVFALLSCLYALTGGGQGYSVDGLFGYQVARSVATDPQREFLVRNRGTLARWGPVVPALGVPFTWAGARLAQIVPPRESVPLDGRVARLYAWPALGAAGEGGAQAELRLPLDSPREVGSLRLVSFLSLATSLEQGTPVAEVLVYGEGGVLGRGVLRAGVETAEWSLDTPSGGGSRHGEAPLAGHWPGNPEANLYLGRVALESPGAGSGAAPGGAVGTGPGIASGSGLGREVVFRYLPPAGRLHLRAVLTAPPPSALARLPAPVVDGPALEIPGPATWSAEDQEAFFTRFGYSFLNGLLMAGTAALLVPLAGLLGYGRRVGVAVALVFGVATPAWPYARYDFAEPAAGLFMLGATALIFGAAGRGAGDGEARRRAGWGGLALLGGAGVLAALAAGAKYTAAWCLPLLATQVLLLWGLRNWRRALVSGVAFLAPAVLGGAVVLLLAGRAPALWTGWRQGIASGWLDFAVTDGLYGLLLSPGKGLLLYAPPLLLALAGLPLFVRRLGWRAFVFVALPLVYLLVYGSKGVWHGGGWGPRYLVPALPFVAMWALPVAGAAFAQGRGWLRAGVALLVVAGVAVQVLGVAKHPNRYTVMFRDHLLPGLPAYGAHLGGAPALTYWRHFGGPEAGRQLARPPLLPGLGTEVTGGPGPAPAPVAEGDAPRGLGYAFAETGALSLRVEMQREVQVAATVYACDWDHRERRQRLTVIDRGGQREHTLDSGFAPCEYLTWPVSAGPGRPLELRVESLAGDVPVLSGLFFDPLRPLPEGGPARDATTGGAWPGRYGADGYLLFGWRRGGVDVGRPPPYVSGYSGGERVWLDTGEAELADTALLYAPAFSPLLAHAWLLGSDAVAILFPARQELQERALASPPWRYLAGLELHAPHPEYGLGLDFWPGLLRDGFRSHPGVMGAVWVTTVALLLGLTLTGAALWRDLRLPRPARWLASPPPAPRPAPAPPAPAPVGPSPGASGPGVPPAPAERQAERTTEQAAEQPLEQPA